MKNLDGLAVFMFFLVYFLSSIVLFQFDLNSNMIIPVSLSLASIIAMILSN